MSEQRDDDRGFRVTDRRRFSESGDTRKTPTETVPPTTDPAASASAGVAPAASAVDEPVTFTTFILGLSTQALFHLGDVADPATGRVERDLVAAKQVIDILGILREKTRGNVEPAEEGLLDSMLYDLRIRYVALVRSGAKEGT